MGYSWKPFQIRRFFGLDLKTNIVDVKDGKSLDLQNVYQDSGGVVKKRPGHDVMFEADEASALAVDDIGTCTLAGTKYWFKIVDGNFKYATSRTGALTTLSPSPAISTSNTIWTAVLDDKLFFVDGTNALRYFDGSAISTSSIYQRPTVAMTTASGAGGYDYVYTVDNGLGESPAIAAPLVGKVSVATVRVAGNTGPQTLVAGDVVRVYSRATSVAAASKLVAEHTWDASDVSAGYSDIVTVAIADDQTQLYSELGVALNYSAVTGLEGIAVHYGRLVGWKGDYQYNSKVTNPHSWPTDTAQRQAFVYGVGLGDGEDVQVCVSFRESLYVFKNSNVFVFGGIGPDDTGNGAYSYRRLEVNGQGCVAGKTAQVIGERDRSFLVWLSRNRFMATDGTSLNEIGEEIENQISGTPEAVLQAAVSTVDKQLGLYLCAFGASTKTVWVFDVREDAGVLIGWWKWNGFNPKCMAWDADRMIYGDSQGICGSQRVAGTSTDFRDIRQEYVATGAVNVATNEITVTESYATADPIVFRSSGAVPTGLTANTTYYAIRVSATVIKVASSAANASAGTAIDITGTGSGTHSLISWSGINAYYTTNWIHFGNPMAVKKLAKAGFIFNALAQSINLTISYGYDWVTQFYDSGTVSLGSTEAWGGGDTWGSFIWGGGAGSTPKNSAKVRRKVRAIRYKFANSTVDQDFNLQGIVQYFDVLRNRAGFA